MEYLKWSTRWEFFIGNEKQAKEVDDRRNIEYTERETVNDAKKFHIIYDVNKEKKRKWAKDEWLNVKCAGIEKKNTLFDMMRKI